MTRNYIDDLIKMIREPPICPECGAFLEQKSRAAWVCPECGYFDLDMEAFE